MINGVLQNVNSYQNRTGRPTFNFYPTDADHFPNGLLMHRFKHFKLPDDADDTALVYLLKEASKDKIEMLRVLLTSHSAFDGVYDTWFGVNMPSERDVCALCNVMLLVSSSGLEFSKNDLATLCYLNSVIVEDLFRENTFWVSRHYATVPLIVYHYARLLSFVNLPQLREAKEALQTIIPGLFKKEENKMNRILLSSSALRLDLEIKEENTMRTKDQEFYSFIGAPFAPLPDSLSKKIADKRWAWIGWKCEAHEVALELENIVLKQQNYERTTQ
ncbi:hypothetical protein [Jiulongibacter sp. NS-SX5]|uniref:hypothetical protein n=1 Tax=Jiulongibacter sp. NS-SX5 TaxID=3463854 RepID=UPI004057EFB0